MANQQAYIERSRKERICLKNIFSKFSNEYDFKWYFTDEESKEKYDCLLIKYKKLTATILGIYFIEIKVRDEHYPNLMLERIKYNNLKDLVNKYDKRMYNDKPSEIVYVSTTPEGSYWWNLSKYDMNKVEWVYEEHWVSTMNKSLGKEMKWLTYLPITDAKFIPVKSTDQVIYDTKVVERILTHQKQYNGLYSYLFGKPDNI